MIDYYISHSIFSMPSRRKILSASIAVQRAFSLLELLCVIAIIAVLAVATIPSVRGIMDGVNVSGAAAVVEAEISLARQTAMSRNLPVEVRFYKHDDGTGEAWRQVGVLISASSSGLSSDLWITPAKTLPGNIIMEDSGEFSTILSKATAPPWTGTESTSAPPSVRGKNYVGFRFHPDGTSNLPSNEAWCLTFKNPFTKSQGEAPAANYVALVLDSLTGRTVSYQP